jgi:hypothetical protein
MKIYLFNPETGVYLGEDFADEVPMERGAFVLPPDATTIAPPRVEPEQIPVFNAGEQRWEVRSSRRCSVPDT